MMTWIITNHYKSQVYHDMNHHKSEITTNHHKPWHKPPWTITETSTKHDMNHYKSPQTMTWTIMMTQKELCIKPYGFLVILLVNVIICNVLILRLLMQTVTVYVVCVVTFIVQTSYFLFSFLLGRGICGIPSFYSLAIPLIFSFSIILPGLFRCLIHWLCRSNPFTVTTIWKDTGILETNHLF